MGEFRGILARDLARGDPGEIEGVLLKTLMEFLRGGSRGGLGEIRGFNSDN